MRRPIPRPPRSMAVLFVLGLLAYATLPGWSEEPQSLTREQQIAELERLIAEQTKKLKELKEAPAAPVAPSAPSVPDGTIPEEWAKTLQWRCIGPANMGGRITAISVYEADPSTYWVATASGGLLKTTNNGVSFTHQFDHEATISVGHVCVAPSNKDIVYVGTGEANPRNSVSYGDGVYKSTDGGATWKNVGLKKSFQIGKIIVHPKDPNTVYVGALGRLYGPNEERGLYKTTDGGTTWKKIFHVDDKTGVIDMIMNPADPETLIAAFWERKRDEYDGYFENPPVPDQYGPVVTHAPGSALYKTTDGGKTFKKLDKGLPTAKLGRIGLDWSRKNPKVVFAIIDTENAGKGTPPIAVFMGIQGENAEPGAKLTNVTEDGPAAKAGLKAGDVVVKFDGKDVAGYDQMTDLLREKKVGDKVKVAIKREKESKELEVTLAARPEEGGRGGGGRGGQGGFGGRPIVSAGFRGEEVKEGVKVTSVQENGPAAKAGLKVDDIVTAAEGKELTDFREFMMETARDRKVGEKMKLAVLSGKDKKEITVTLEELAFAPGGGGGGRGGLPGAGARDRPYSTGLGGQRANVQDQQGKDGVNTGGIFKSEDGGDTWKRINSLNPRPMYFSKIRVDPSDDNNVYVTGVGFAYSTDGGKRFQSGKDQGVHSDHHALWIDPRDGRHMIIGTDGGFYVTYDRGEKWDHHNFQALGQFYHVAIDHRANYKVYGGLQDNGSWGGPAFSPRGGIVNEDWIYVQGGDGFVCRVDPTDPDMVYTESQGGAINRRNFRTGERGGISPRRAAGATVRHRFNWNTPFILSHHNPSIFYSMGEMVFRSVKKGADLKAISPELTRSKMGSGTALSESPLNPDVLWAGTDDGNLWVTKDGGAKWVNVADKVQKAGLPGFRWVATIEASKYSAGKAYVCFDAHRSDDDKPYLFVTDDYGETWKNITSNLPAFGSTRCLREDIVSQNVLYCGTEFGAFASANRGASWTKINNNLPTVAVHELAQHPITGEIVAATHGRSIWITDISAIRQMSPDVIKEKAHLYSPATAIRWRVEANRGMFSGADRKFVGTNPARGASIYYSLTNKAEKVEVKILDFSGRTVASMNGYGEPGFFRVTWDFGRQLTIAPGREGPGGGGRFGGGGRGGAGGPGGGRPGGGGTGAGTAPASPSGPGFPTGGQAIAGNYRVVLTVDGKESAVALRVEADPTAPVGIGVSEQEDEEPFNWDLEERRAAKRERAIIPDRKDD